MKKIALVISVLLVCNIYGYSFNQMTGNGSLPIYKIYSDTLKNKTAENKRNESQKFFYAEFIYQYSYVSSKQWVNGSAVSETVAKAVSAAKYRSDALDILGNDGWELTTSFTRNFDNGYEMYYYFKKKMN